MMDINDTSGYSKQYQQQSESCNIDVKKLAMEDMSLEVVLDGDEMTNESQM